MTSVLQILFALSVWWCGLTNFLALWILFTAPRETMRDDGSVFRYLVAMSAASIAVTAGIAALLR